MNILFIQWRDIPFLIIIVIGVFIPEIYLRMHWALRTLMVVRMATLLITCVLATYLNHLMYPSVDTGTVFTRAFIFIGVSRMIMLSSHQIAEHDHPQEKK